MADNGIAQGVGVNEDTAVLVDLDSGVWEIVGTSQALVVELEDPGDPTAAIVHLLGHGDRYDTVARRAVVNGALGDITGDPFLTQAPIFKLGVFNADVVPEIITLAVDTIGETSGVGIDFLGSADPRYSVYGVQLRFAQTDLTLAYLCFRSCRGDNPNRSGSLARYSVNRHARHRRDPGDRGHRGREPGVPPGPEPGRQGPDQGRDRPAKAVSGPGVTRSAAAATAYDREAWR